MREIGIVKWFGGYNSKTGRDNNYGFIACGGKPDIFVHRRQVRCSESALPLHEGTPVTFEIGINLGNGKEEAKKLLLLTEETNLEIVAHCARSCDKKLWKPVFEHLATLSINEAVSLAVEKMDTLSSWEKQNFARSLTKNILLSCRAIREALPTDDHLDLCLEMLNADMNTDIDPNLREEIIATIETETYHKEELWGKVPLVLYENDPDVRKHLPLRIHVTCLTNLVLNAEQAQSKDTLLSELRERLEESSESDIWELIPDAILLEDQVWPISPRNRRIAILAAQLSEEGKPENEDTVSRIARVLAEGSRKERPSLVSTLPDWVKQHDTIFAFLPPVDQVNLVWSALELDSLPVWQRISRKAKILCVYRAAKENISLPVLEIIHEEDDPLLKCALILLWAKDNLQKRGAAFKEAHTLFQDYVVDRAWSSTEPLDLYPLLPHCRSEVVRYCEGRPWPEEDEKSGSHRVSRAFCPRAKGPCPLLDLTENVGGARLYAECSQDWEDWSLLELIEVTGVVPRVPGLSRPDEYVPKLSGWINRLNEIRERLKCSVCGQMMVPNYKYAKNLARYNMTVASCQRGCVCNQNVYLNHCWACREIIDSRESTIRVEEYYICIHCGSGPQESNSYTQGDICPKCGTRGMSTNQRNYRIRECRSCNHEIRLPPEQYLRGPGSKRGRNFI